MARTQAGTALARAAPALLALAVALAAGGPAAANQKARSLELGRDGAYDPARAARLYCTAAQAGDADAAFALGRLYLGGRGVPRNAAMGAAWLARAARLGHRSARALAPEVGVSRLPSPRCLGSGRLSPKAEPAPEIAALARRAADRHGIDPALVLAVMRIESGFDARALSPKGAMGLMQLMPDTAARFGVRDAYDPEQNLRGGAAYLRFLLERFEGDVALAGAAYNAGEGAVDRHGGVPPYAETQAYVQALRSIYPRRRHPVGQEGAGREARPGDARREDTGGAPREETGDAG